MRIQYLSGEADGIARVVNSLFSILGTDARIKRFFKAEKREQLKQGVTVFLVDRFGGPKDYEGASAACLSDQLQLNPGRS